MRDSLETYGPYAALYDVAFSWDVGDEVAWLWSRLSPAETLLEPGCGSGRMFPAFRRLGAGVVGLDRSDAMLARARERMARAGFSPPDLVRADMARFDLGRVFDGAYCPINTFGYLATPEDARSHLDCMGRHLKPGARYLLQVCLQDLERYEPSPASDWESEVGDVRVRTTWSPRSYDRASGLETQFVRFEVRSGRERGRVVEETHGVRLWSWETWARLVEASPFEQAAAFDGVSPGYPPLELGPALDGFRLTWHELVRDSPPRIATRFTSSR